MMTVKFEPKIPGSYVELYTSRGANVALRFSARATLPLCHIECEPNNYLETQRPSSMPTPYVFSQLMAENIKCVKVLLIQACGVGSRQAQTISILNTVDTQYQITLERMPESTDKIQTNISEYSLTPGEKLQLKFTYACDKNSIKECSEEAFYILRIPQYNVQIPLLIVGLPREPDVSINTSKVNFGQLGCG